MTYRFRLIDENGVDLGPLAAQRADWTIGDQLSRWHGEQLTIVGIVEAEDHEPFAAYLVVRAS